MGVMTVPDVWSGQDRMLTVEDMENMPDDEFRYELDDGVLIVSPAPSTLHQLAVARLTVILSAACPAEMVVLPGVGAVAEAMKLIPDGGRRDEAFTQDLVWQRSSLLISAERGDLENEFVEITAEQADEIANRIRQSASIKPVP